MNKKEQEKAKILEKYNFNIEDSHRHSNNRKYPISFKREVVLDYLLSDMSIPKICEKHDIHRIYIYRWEKLFLKVEQGIIDPDSCHKLKEEIITRSTVKAKEKQYKNQIKKLELRVLSLEYLIEEAESKLEVSIRKKPGTKQ